MLKLFKQIIRLSSTAKASQVHLTYF